MNRSDLTFLGNKSYSITLQSLLTVPYIVREVIEERKSGFQGSQITPTPN